jgi:hypothetical protein
MRSRIQKALIITTGALAITMISQSPASAADYLAGEPVLNTCTPYVNPDVPSACVCILTSTCTLDVYPDYGNTISNDIGQVCRVSPTAVKNALSAGEPRIENPCSSFPSGG